MISPGTSDAQQARRHRILYGVVPRNRTNLMETVHENLHPVLSVLVPYREKCIIPVQILCCHTAIEIIGFLYRGMKSVYGVKVPYLILTFGKISRIQAVQQLPVSKGVLRNTFQYRKPLRTAGIAK